MAFKSIRFQFEGDAWGKINAWVTSMFRGKQNLEKHNELKVFIEEKGKELEDKDKEIKRLNKEIKRLNKTLEIYADPTNWDFSENFDYWVGPSNGAANDVAKETLELNKKG